MSLLRLRVKALARLDDTSFPVGAILSLPAPIERHVAVLDHMSGQPQQNQQQSVLQTFTKYEAG